VEDAIVRLPVKLA